MLVVSQGHYPEVHVPSNTPLQHFTLYQITQWLWAWSRSGYKRGLAATHVYGCIAHTHCIRSIVS